MEEVVIKQHRMRLSGAYRAFNGAVEQLDKAISQGRQATPVPKKPGRMILAVPDGESEFELTVKMTRRLREVTQAEGRIVCQTGPSCSKGACRSVLALWRRAGEALPEIEHTDKNLTTILEGHPLVVIMRPNEPKKSVKGYIKMTLPDPFICLLLREAT